MQKSNVASKTKVIISRKQLSQMSNIPDIYISDENLDVIVNYLMSISLEGGEQNESDRTIDAAA